MSESLSRLTEINLDDLVNSIGWQENPILSKAMRMIFHKPAEKFARQMLAFDQMVGETGLAAASRIMLKRYVKDVCVYGSDNFPGNGPILVLSNHPGMTDTLCLFAAINRPDLRIIALDRPFLQSLPNLSRHQFFISEKPSERMSVVRKTAAHLRNHGAVLTFPAGKIEPDPDVYPGALESLDAWTDSAGVFIRMAPETMIVPMLVRNVLWKKAVKNPITRLKQDRVGREKLGAAIQLMFQVIFDLHPVAVRVQIGAPIIQAEKGSHDLMVLHAAVLSRMKSLIENPPEGVGISVL